MRDALSIEDDKIRLLRELMPSGEEGRPFAEGQKPGDVREGQGTGCSDGMDGIKGRIAEEHDGSVSLLISQVHIRPCNAGELSIVP
jgi:hypothetical protein